MNEDKKIQFQENENTDYTVSELIQELMNDESWEPDPEYRKKAIGMLLMSVFPAC